MLTTAYELVRSDKDDTTWLLLNYEVCSAHRMLKIGPCCFEPVSQDSLADVQSDKSDKLVLSETGTGDLAEFASKLDPTKASFGFVRVTYSNDDHSQRVKFAFVTWIGEQVKVMRRAKVSVHSSDVKNVIRSYSIEVSAENTDDLKEVSHRYAGLRGSEAAKLTRSQDDIVQRMRKAGGANYDRSKFD